MMFLELIGNDVCKDSFNRMTTVEEFRVNVVKLLKYLDGRVTIEIFRYLLEVI